jgi:AraC-like DNA-binding protein
MTFGALAIATNILQSLCGPDFRLLQDTLAFPRPNNTSLFRSFFDAPIRLEAERSAIAFAARYGEAQRMLQSSALTVTEIASRLGYADTATFTRAFRRWSGTSSRRWHARNRALWSRTPVRP